MRAGAVALSVMLVTGSSAAGLPSDLSASDVCALVPGSEVAAAVGGRLEEVRLIRPEGRNARCVYTVGFPTGRGGGKAAFVVWLHPPGDFVGLRAAGDRSARSLEGLGDEAVIAHDPDSGRSDLLVLVRGLATIEVTGPDADQTQAVAGAAIDALRRAAASAGGTDRE